MKAKETFSRKSLRESSQFPKGYLNITGDGKRKVEAAHASVNTVHLSLLWMVVSFWKQENKANMT